jgi:prephenate dehydrogenase
MLADSVDAHARGAERLGAGHPRRGEHVDVAVVAVPPRSAASVVCSVLRSEPDCTVCDTASVKGNVQRDIAASLGNSTDAEALSRYVGGHPIAGSERSGVTAARGDLFNGRTWVLTPSPRARRGALDDARWLAEECGARVVVMDADDHDRAVAGTSHLPQLVASALAARLSLQPDWVLATAGPGLRDLIRVAGSDPDLWVDIVSANAAPIADALTELTTDLKRLALALGGNDPEPELRRVLENGRRGYRRITTET